MPFYHHPSDLQINAEIDRTEIDDVLSLGDVLILTLVKVKVTLTGFLL